MRKKRILFVNECSYLLNSGFSNIGKAIIPRLIATGKYEIAELCNYIPSDSQELENCPWKTYCSMPRSDDQQGNALYNSTMHAQFGSLMLDHACLDFKSDVVYNWCDFWMGLEYMRLCPSFLKNKFILVPMQDSLNSPAHWYSEYEKIEVLVAACNFAKKVYNKCNPKLKVWKDNANFSVDEKIFRPLDKKECRRKLGIPEDCNLILKSSRNQPRKLFADLMDTFKLYLEKCIEKDKRELAENTFLFIFSSFPDVGYDFGKHLIRTGLGNRVLFCYICQNCKQYFVSPFSTEICHCKFCGQISCCMPNTSNGLLTEDLPIIFNSADLYVQMSVAEGVSMTVDEARSCGIPVACTDYSALSDKVEEGSIPLKVDRLYHETDSQTGQLRALTDVSDSANKIFDFFNLSTEAKKSMGEHNRKVICENYTFDRAAKIFEEIIDTTPIHDPQTTWFNPTPNFPPNKNPAEVNHKDPGAFIDWCIINMVGRPDLVDSHWRNELLKALNTGVYIGRGGREPMNAHKIVEIMRNLTAKHAHWENERLKMLRGPQPKQLDIEVV